MTVTSKQWIDQVAKAAKNQDWDVLTTLEVEVNQSFADKRDWPGVEQFYTEALKGSVKSDVIKKVTVKDIAPFQTGVEHTLKLASQRAAEDSNIKAIYFEYFFDGGDSCTGNAFLCTAYNEEHDEWAAAFDGANGLIEGPSVFEYLNYDPDIDFDPRSNAVASAYVNGFLLAAWGRAVDKQREVKLPMGFAQHDHPVIKVRSNK